MVKEMEEQRLVVRKKDIFSKIRVLVLTIIKKQENKTKRSVIELKQLFEEGKITLGDLTEEELKEYNELLENEMREIAKRELYVYNCLMTAK
jgi:deoxyadenosine/deoxycytidine kinase